MELQLQPNTINGTTVDTTDGRELQRALDNHTDYSTWIKRALTRAYLVENADYCKLHRTVEHVSGAKHAIEYHLTHKSAKSIAMTQRSELGKQVRDYYISLEKDNTLDAITTAKHKLELAQLEYAKLELERGEVLNASKLLLRYRNYTGGMKAKTFYKLLDSNMIAYKDGSRWFFDSDYEAYGKVHEVGGNTTLLFYSTTFKNLLTKII